MEKMEPLLLAAILELEKIRKVPQFFYYHGINLYGTIKVRNAVINFKNENPEVKEIDFIINSPGGSGDDAYRIIRTLRKNFEKVNIIVPFWAKSAATLLSLGASSIIMDEFGEFGALDVQLPKQRDDSPHIVEGESALIDELSLETIEQRSHQLFLEMFVSLYTNKYVPIHKNDIANDIMNYLSKFYEPLLKQINPYKIGDKKRKLDIGAQYAKRILIQYNEGIKKEDREKFVDYLVNDCPDHGYIVDYDLIKKFLPTFDIKQSKELNADFPGYEKKLRDVSFLLLLSDSEKEKYIDFVSNSLKKNEKKEPSTKNAGSNKVTRANDAKKSKQVTEKNKTEKNPTEKAEKTDKSPK